MKIVIKTHVSCSERLIAENVNKYYSKIIVELLNVNFGGFNGTLSARAVDDDFEIGGRSKCGNG